jgi:hypothetical protein
VPPSGPAPISTNADNTPYNNSGAAAATFYAPPSSPYAQTASPYAQTPYTSPATPIPSSPYEVNTAPPSFPGQNPPAYGYPSVPPSFPPQPPKPKLSKGALFAIIGLTILLLASGGGLIFYSTVYYPAQQHAAATSTSVAATEVQQHQTATAEAQQTSTAVAYVTATAQAHVTATAQAQATVQARQDIYTQATSGTPALNDPLSDQSGSDWHIYDTDTGGGCFFSGGSLHSSILAKGYYVPCVAQSSDFSNFAIEVDATISKGDAAGVFFRSDDETDNSYSFFIYSDGYYSLSLRKDSKGDSLLSRKSSSIHTGEGKTNTITLVVRDQTITVFINKEYVTQIDDGTLSSGKVGVAGLLSSDATQDATDAYFKNLRVWTL